MLRRRRLQAVEERLHRLERRLDDTEDTVAASLSGDRIDDLAQRVEEVAAMAAPYDDLLQARMHTARLGVDLEQARAELLAEIDRLQSMVDDLAEPQVGKRAFGR